MHFRNQELIGASSQRYRRLLPLIIYALLCVTALLLVACQPVTPESQATDDASAPLPAMERTPLVDALPNMEPQDVWQNFYEVTQVPRPSGHDEEMRSFLVAFGQNLGLETIVDDAGNVLIRKPAAPGKENLTGIILQAHMDMVAQKTPDSVHDFMTDPIAAYVDGEWVTAEGTTLGADDGIGIAMAMAMLQSDTLEAGPLEALFTVDEETTMSGADGLSPDLLQGEIYINLDGEEEGMFIIGSAGGATVQAIAEYSQVDLPSDMAAYTLSVQGLKGGHSGVDIDKGRGHAIKLLVRFLSTAESEYGLRITAIEGGSAGNAIPREASAFVSIPASQTDAFIAAADAYQSTIQNELSAVEPDLRVVVEPADLPTQVMAEVDQRMIGDALYATPQGVIRMSDAVPGLVETSTNMGIVQVSDGELDASCYVRSSVDSSLDDLLAMIASVWDMDDIEVSVSGRYAGWAPNADSAILALMEQVYEEMYGQAPDVSAVHAGLECGTVVAKYPGMDAISLGPTIQNVHSPDEALHVPSVSKTFEFLQEVLQQAPSK